MMRSMTSVSAPSRVTRTALSADGASAGESAGDAETAVADVPVALPAALPPDAQATASSAADDDRIRWWSDIGSPGCVGVRAFVRPMLRCASRRVKPLNDNPHGLRGLRGLLRGGCCSPQDFQNSGNSLGLHLAVRAIR